MSRGPWSVRYHHRDDLIRIYTEGVTRARLAYYGDERIDYEAVLPKAARKSETKRKKVEADKARRRVAA